MAQQCTALNLSDGKRCLAAATSANGHFCAFHSRQCFGLYRGYKRRNARLDALSESPPEYLVDSTIPLANQTFADVESENTLNELHQHLFLKYSLLDRVIRARQLHHSRFYSLSLDYGHQHYLDTLSNQKFIVLRALERLQRRVTEVLYKKRKWFKWVRDCQDEEESQREKESKRVKLDAAMFKRHMIEVERRMKELRAKEEAQRQDRFLEEVYNERMAMQEDLDDENWDPIDDVVNNERGNFVDLIRHFLWQDASIKPEHEEPGEEGSMESSTSQVQEPAHSESATENRLVATTRPSKTSKRKEKAKIGPGQAPAEQEKDTGAKSETKEEMRRRLKEGSELKHEYGPVALLLRGTIENPLELQTKTVSLPDDEINRLLAEIYEIKHLIFCRLLLSYASLLPAALRADSVDEFLNNKEIPYADLRDLCRKMEDPGLQEIRDACADLARNEEEDSDGEGDVSEDEDKSGNRKLKVRDMFRPRKLPRSWVSKRERQLKKHRKARGRLKEQSDALGDEVGAFIDFGAFDDEDQYKAKKMRIKVCGRSIYNYRSEKSMSRRGWLHFCIIAKNSNLYDAIQLCRNWDEFFELNILACFRYFPAANWLSWVGDQLRQQQLLLGFIPYAQCPDADKVTVRHQTGSRSGRRKHAVLEARNYICAHVKRNDAAIRRFIQYLSMQTGDIILLVRDAATGRILVKPPEEELWLLREKSGIGRAAKNEWNVLEEVGPDFFKKMDDTRRWHFGFPDYYDVYVWDATPGLSFHSLYCYVQETLIKAYRFRSGPDFYNAAAPVLKTLTKDNDNHRVRDIKPGEDVMSVYDEIHHEDTRFVFHESTSNAPRDKPPTYLLYNEVDALEDQVLFPEEHQEDASKAPFREITNAMRRVEDGDLSLERFIFDLDTDEELSTEDEYSVDSLEDRDDDLSDDDSVESDEEDPGESDETTAAHLHRELSEIEEREVLEIVEDWVKKKPKRFSIDEQFEEWMDREKAASFKKTWHRADLEPGAQEKYVEMNDMVKEMLEYSSNQFNRGILRILLWLDINPLSHRRVWRDLKRADAMVHLFSQTHLFDSEKGSQFRDSVLINQTERAQGVLDRRRHDSVKCLPKSTFEEWDKMDKNGFIRDFYPLEWDMVVRPIIAHLFKEGVICNSYYSYPTGTAIVSREPNSNRPDMFLDYRDMLSDIHMPPELQDPRILPPSSFRSVAASFSKTHPSARFAVLRLWSAPHFYPLMIGWEKREQFAFLDCLGRHWAWKFVPKDMPYSEWSIHNQARLRIAPFTHVFGEKVIVRRDLYFVMGVDEEELLKLATAVVYAVQTRPWRLEIDLWKSFINVDQSFIERLEDRWLN